MILTASTLDRSQQVEIEIHDQTATVAPVVRDPSGQDSNPQATTPQGHQTTSNRFIFAGFCDLQVNGFNGVNMADLDLTVDQIEEFCRQQMRLGVTQLLPTITTNSIASLGKSLENLNRLADESEIFRSVMAGIHLEGPYISKEDGPRGAHPAQFCCEPNLEDFQWLQEKSGGRIRIVTLSPEYEAAKDFIEQVSKSCFISIGHTAATPAEIRQAVQAGARMSTHLGNGMHPVIARHPNYLWEQLAADQLAAGLIADGVHLDAATLKSFIRAKGIERCFLVSDSTVLSGQPPGRYSDSSLGDVEVTADQRLVIAGQRILNAGAYRPLIYGVEHLIREIEVSVLDAFRMGSDIPRNLLGLPVWSTESNTFVVCDIPQNQPLQVLLVVKDGELVYSAQSA